MFAYLPFRCIGELNEKTVSYNYIHLYLAWIHQFTKTSNNIIHVDICDCCLLFGMSGLNATYNNCLQWCIMQNEYNAGSVQIYVYDITLVKIYCTHLEPWAHPKRSHNTKKRQRSAAWNVAFEEGYTRKGSLRIWLQWIVAFKYVYNRNVEFEYGYNGNVAFEHGDKAYRY